jgi:tRNA (cytidine/uridine-2'-O-)-methyltransferase
MGEFDALHQTAEKFNFKYFSARAEGSYLEADYRIGDFIVFGSETKGLGAEFLTAHHDASYRIPIFEAGVRSLNLAKCGVDRSLRSAAQDGFAQRLADELTTD